MMRPADDFAFPPGFAVQEIATNGTDHPRPRRRIRAGRRAAARLWRERRHVGAAGGGLVRDHTRDRARPARPRPVLQASRRLSTRRLRRATSPACWRRWGRGRSTSWRTTSATWSPCSSRRSIPSGCRRLVLIDAPVPGVGPWEEILKNPLLWHFRFGGPDMERLVAGRERIYLDRFWNEFSADPAKFTEAARVHYAAAIRDARRHARRLRAVRRIRPGRDRQPRLARAPGAAERCRCSRVGGEKSFGETMATVMRAGATEVQSAIIPAQRPLDHGGEPASDNHRRSSLPCWVDKGMPI